MASIVKQSRLIFIDSELNGHQNAVVTFPSQPFSVCCSDHMRLTLLSFQMRRNWYSVNSTNNTFYILNAVSYGAYAEIKIVPESYETMVELAAAVQTAYSPRHGARLAASRHQTRRYQPSLTSRSRSARNQRVSSDVGGS